MAGACAHLSAPAARAGAQNRQPQTQGELCPDSEERGRACQSRGAAALCVCVCVCVCKLFMRISYVRMHACVVCMSVRTRTHSCTHAHTHMHACAHTHKRTSRSSALRPGQRKQSTDRQKLRRPQPRTSGAPAPFFRVVRVFSKSCKALFLLRRVLKTNSSPPPSDSCLHAYAFAHIHTHAHAHTRGRAHTHTKRNHTHTHSLSCNADTAVTAKEQYAETEAGAGHLSMYTLDGLLFQPARPRPPAVHGEKGAWMVVTLHELQDWMGQARGVTEAGSAGQVLP